MALQDLLLALKTHPEPTASSAVEQAVDIAVAVGARISAVACALRFQAPGNILANALLDVPAMAAAETKKSLTNAEALLAAFQAAAEKRGVFEERAIDQCLPSEVAETLVERARFHDLTILPVAKGELFEPWSAEWLVFGSGRPTLVLPEGRARATPFALDAVLVAWDSSRAATRALADAMPLLAKAKRVCVLTVVNEKAIAGQRTGADLAKHLARHGVTAAAKTVDAAGRKIGDVLAASAADERADLLVMGGYGHSRLREFVLGGATRSMIAHPPLPILMSH